MSSYFILRDQLVEDEDAHLHCTLIAAPAQDAPRPGVMIFPDLWGVGRQSFEWGRRLVEEGYVVLCVDMFGNATQAENLEHGLRLFEEVTQDRERWRRRAQRLFNAFRARPETHECRIAAIGFCFGGSSALHLACTGAQLAGVVCLHGDIPRISSQEAKTIAARLLICNGAADPLVPNSQIVDLGDDLCGSSVDWRLLLLGEAGHSFTNPDAARANMPGVVFDPRAEARAWGATRAFLKEVLNSAPVDETPTRADTGLVQA